jgi:carbamoyl-phosphate synthase large subunit
MTKWCPQHGYPIPCYKCGYGKVAAVADEMKTWAFDMDNTICLTLGTDYEHAIPRHNIIEKINKLYKSGRHVIIFTGRGSVSKIDWRDLTEKQLEKWGVNYHELIMGKPHYDIFIDDKSYNVKDFEEFRV